MFLRLDSNQIRFVHPDAFANCVAILHLDLSSNRLTHIPPRLFYSLVKLEDIELHSQTTALLHIDDYAFERDKLPYSNWRFSLQIDTLILGHSGNGGHKSRAEIRFAPRAFCSRHLSNNTLGGLSSSFVPVRHIELDHEPSHFYSCLFAQLQHRDTFLSNGDLRWRSASACKCPPLTLEEEQSFCAGDRDHELGEAKRACWTLTTTTTTSTTSPTSTTIVVETITTEIAKTKTPNNLLLNLFDRIFDTTTTRKNVFFDWLRPISEMTTKTKKQILD